MIYAYGITAQGTHHIKTNTPCQDAHNIRKISNDIVVAAVADGLGSEKYSDIASKIAADTSVNYCFSNISKKDSGEAILNVIRSSFDMALKRIKDEATREGNDFFQYGTTLTLAVMVNNSLYYGHAGDSGIIVLKLNGLYKKITEQQRDDDGFVFPFTYNKEKWEFGTVENVASVLLATDGMLETFFPIYLRDERVNLYVTLARYFMDINSLHIDEVGEGATQDRILKFICNIPDAQVNDDKTIAVLVNTAVKVEMQPPEYYLEPDWAELKQKRNEAWKREAYPHLFKDETNNDQAPSDNSEIKNPTTTQEILVKETNNSVPDNRPIIEEEAPIFEISQKEIGLLSKIIDYFKKQFRNQNNYRPGK